MELEVFDQLHTPSSKHRGYNKIRCLGKFYIKGHPFYLITLQFQFVEKASCDYIPFQLC